MPWSTMQAVALHAWSLRLKRPSVIPCKSEPDGQGSYQRCYYDDRGELCLCEEMTLYGRRGHAARMRAFQQTVRLQVAGQLVQLQLDASYAEDSLTVSSIAFPTFEDGTSYGW
jgi:hypothetical protein